MDRKHPVLAGLVFASAVLAGATNLIACAADAAPPSKSEAASGKGSPGSPHASDEAKAELGVDHWTSSEDGTTSTVEGLDASNHAVVEFRSTRNVVDDAHRTVRYDLRTEEGEWFVEVNVEGSEGETNASIAAKSLTDIGPAQRALEIIGNDFNAQHTSLTTQSLQPRDAIVSGCANLVSCVQIVGFDSASFGSCLEAAFNGAALGKCNAAQEADRNIRAQCGGNFDGTKAVCLPKL